MSYNIKSQNTTYIFLNFSWHTHNRIKLELRTDRHIQQKRVEHYLPFHVNLSNITPWISLVCCDWRCSILLLSNKTNYQQTFMNIKGFETTPLWICWYWELWGNSVFLLFPTSCCFALCCNWYTRADCRLKCNLKSPQNCWNELYC